MRSSKFILTSPIHKVIYRKYIQQGRLIKVVMGYYINNEED